MKRYISNLSVNMLLVLDAVYRNKNTHAAAKELGMTQPAVSKSLKRLSEISGKELFVKESRNLAITDEGKEFWRKSKDILMLCEEILIEDSSCFDPNVEKQKFTIVIPSIDTDLFIQKLVVDALKSYPLIDIDLISAPAPEAYELLENGEAHTYIGYLKRDITKAMVSQKISKMSFNIIGRKTLPEKISKDGFSNALHLFVHRQYHESGLDEQLDSLGLKQTNIKRIPDMMLVNEVLKNCDAMYLATDHQSSILLDSNEDLQRISPNFDLPEVDIHLIWLRKHNKGAAHIWLRDLIIKQIGKL